MRKMSCSACSDRPCDGHRSIQWFDKFFGAVVAIGTLGAGFTFSVIFSEMENLNDQVDTNTVRHFLIIAWLLFVLSVAIASMCAALFQFMDREYIWSVNNSGKVVKSVKSLGSLVLQLLIVAAFIMSARALRRYDEDSGKAAEVIIGIFGCLLIVIWIYEGYSEIR